MWPDLSRARVLIRPGVTDMRKQINGLSAMVQNAMAEVPFSGDLFHLRKPPPMAVVMS